MNKIFKIAKFEYLSAIKRPAFWLATIFMPLLIGILSFISGYSGEKGEEALTKLNASITDIAIVDQTGLINPDLIQKPLYKETDLDKAIGQVQQSQINALIYFPKELIAEGKYFIYIQDTNIFVDQSYSTVANSLIEQSAYLSIKDTNTLQMLNKSFQSETVFYDKTGQTISGGFSRFILPGISLLIFFISVFVSAQFMLQSVSEEKENRMIETILGMVNSKQLIYGKIIGFSSVVITQLLVWFVLGLLTLNITISQFNFKLNLDLSSISFTDILLNIFFILCGFLLFSAIMTGVGALSTSYKDSQNLSSIFIILSILPMYFFMIIVADPSGVVSRLASYFPLTSPMVFLLRNSITELASWELLLGIILNIIFTAIAFKIAIKCMDIGALFYNRRPSWKEMRYVLTNKSS